MNLRSGSASSTLVLSVKTGGIKSGLLDPRGYSIGLLQQENQAQQDEACSAKEIGA